MAIKERIYPEPFAALFVFRHDPCHHIPEILGMVHMGQVAELMDHHIVQYRRAKIRR